jgi:hypothetical protein
LALRIEPVVLRAWRRASNASTDLFFSTLSRFNQEVLIDTTPLPSDIPAVKEVGASSAPLLSASFFIGARCRDYNDDYMQCKTENPGKGELDCMKEGRRVTRCASSVYVTSWTPYLRLQGSLIANWVD